ncbi:MAG: phage tail assembly protein [Treponema sp.]|jgi:hypothetical protein|nr:phage tail assembly protein [Treponema sp.]
MKTFTLEHPVTVGEHTVTELRLQIPKLKHMKMTDGRGLDTVGADIALASALSGEPENVIEQIDLKDWPPIRTHLQRIYFDFFGIDPGKAFTAVEGSKEADPPKPEAI